jgi:hypothetical protein
LKYLFDGHVLLDDALQELLPDLLIDLAVFLLCPLSGRTIQGQMALVGDDFHGWIALSL